MRVGLCESGFIVFVNYLSRVTAGLSLYVAARGVVHICGRLLCACCYLACNFNHLFGHFAPVGYNYGVRAVVVFQMQPYIV